MPGDTKIKNTAGGWIDVDNPTKTYPARWQARNARRNRLALSGPIPVGAPMAGTVPSLQSLAVVKTRLDGTVTLPSDAVIPAFSPSPLSSLQQRLFDRLTQRQGVDATDAESVVTLYGYNKAASYGHMRAAGASHAEAVEVVDLDSPSISLAYGLARFAGLSHTAAFVEALRDLMDDGDDADD